MKKITTTVAAALVAFGFAACNKNSNTTLPEQGDASYASIRVSVKDALKAINDGDQKDNKGTAEESKVSSMALVGAGATWDEADITNAGSAYKGKPKLVTATGAQVLGLVLNNNVLATSTSETTEFGASATAVADLAKVATDNKFVMTSKSMSQTIKPNIKKEDAEAQNLLDFGKVERVVAKGIVQKAAGFDQASENGIVPMEGVKYAAVNGANKSYVYGNQAGGRQLDVNDPNQYAGFKSLIHGIAPTKEAAAAMTAGLIRRGQLGGANLGGYAAKEVSSATVNPGNYGTTLGVSSGVYFLENSGEADAANKAQGFYRFAYAKIYATFVPATVYEIDRAADPEFVAQSGTGKKYKKNPLGKWAESTEADAQEGKLVYKLKKKTDYAKGTTFYMGEKDGRFYISRDAAAQSTIALGQKAFTYKDGRAGYRALWNRQSPDGNTKLVNNASARRNNIYVLNIKKFRKIGMPWDPSDPNDPDLPKPRDPEEPDYPDNPNIEDQDSYVAVQCEVAPWNVVGRDVEL